MCEFCVYECVKVSSFLLQNVLFVEKCIALGYKPNINNSQ